MTILIVVDVLGCGNYSIVQRTSRDYTIIVKVKGVLVGQVGAIQYPNPGIKKVSFKEIDLSSSVHKTN